MDLLLQEDGIPLLDEENGGSFQLEQQSVRPFEPGGVARNRTNVQFDGLRSSIDAAFEIKHDELSDCYYNFWKLGRSKLFTAGGTFNVQGNPARSKALFDKLHACIFYIRDLDFHVENLNQPLEQQIDAALYNEITDDAGTVVDTVSALAQRRLDELEVEGIELVI